MTIANTFGFANKIPVVGVTDGDTLDFLKIITLLEQQSVGKYIIAAYSAEPNITTKKPV